MQSVRTYPARSSENLTTRLNTYVYHTVLEHSKAKGARLAFLLVLAKWADNDGICWPGIATIARALHCSERTAQKLAQKLVEQKELVMELRAGTRKTNRYRICCVSRRPRIARPMVNKSTRDGEQPNACTQNTVFGGSKKKNSSPLYGSQIRNSEGRDNRISNTEEAADTPVAATVPPPVLAEHKREPDPQIQYPAWYFTPPRGGLTKAQARAIYNRIGLEILPRPPENSWLISEIARWKGRL